MILFCSHSRIYSNLITLYFNAYGFSRRSPYTPISRLSFLSLFSFQGTCSDSLKTGSQCLNYYLNTEICLSSSQIHSLSTIAFVRSSRHTFLSKKVVGSILNLLPKIAYVRSSRPTFLSKKWWAQMDSNHRPHAYQACALTT